VKKPLTSWFESYRDHHARYNQGAMLVELVTTPRLD